MATADAFAVLKRGEQPIQRFAARIGVRLYRAQGGQQQAALQFGRKVVCVKRYAAIIRRHPLCL